MDQTNFGIVILITSIALVFLLIWIVVVLPQNRARKDSAALQAYAAMTTSADTGPAAEDRDKVVPSLTRAEIR